MAASARTSGPTFSPIACNRVRQWERTAVAVHGGSKESTVDSFKRIQSGPRAIIILAIRGAIVALVSLPILVFAVQVQERLLGAPPPQVVAFLISFVFAKLVLLVLLGRMLDRLDPIAT